MQPKAIKLLKENYVSDYFDLSLVALYISPVMNVLPSTEVFEGDKVKIICKVVNPPKNVEVFLTRNKRILKKTPDGLVHEFTAQDGDSGEFVCKAEWGSVQKETYQTITVKGKYLQYYEMSNMNHLKIISKE